MLDKDWQYLLSFFAIMTGIMKWDLDKPWAVLQLLNTHICIMDNQSGSSCYRIQIAYTEYMIPPDTTGTVSTPVTSLTLAINALNQRLSIP